MCLLITVAVFVRYVFGIPVVWVPEIVGYLMVALIFLALGEAMLAGSHIKIDLFVTRIPKRLRDLLELFTLTLSTGGRRLLRVAWGENRSALFRLRPERMPSGPLDTPLYIPQAPLPIGLSILTLVLALLVCRKLCVVLNPAEEAEVDLGSQSEGPHS